jgi:hypothetical protein
VHCELLRHGLLDAAGVPGDNLLTGVAIFFDIHIYGIYKEPQGKSSQL